jgi:hypothetical protein
LEKFASALRLRWPWLEWKDKDKIWVGMGNPCSEEDMNLFYAATTITLGSGEKTSFWHAPWLHDQKPKDIAPLLFELCKRKNWFVSQALRDEAWIRKLRNDATISLEHLTQFVHLWALINTIHLHDDVEDDISWKLTANGQYSAASAYKMQFLGLIESSMYKIVWKAWAPPKAKNHAWIALQNRLWTADRLRKRGWENCGLCTLCKQTEETCDHLFVHCRFTIRIWRLIEVWLGLQGLQTAQWTNLSISEWWSLLAEGASPNRKGLASLTLLVVWEIWKERNARVFRNKLSPSFVILDAIKCEVRLWVLAGAKRLGDLLPGE